MIHHEIFPERIVGFNNLWIHFIFREFNCVFMSKIPSPLVHMESWARRPGGCIFFLFHRKSYILFWYILENYKFGYSLDKRVWFAIIFLPLKESLTLSEIWSFFLLYLPLFSLSRIELPKLTPSILMEFLIISFALVDQFYYQMY